MQDESANVIERLSSDGSTPFLSAQKISKTYGGVTALIESSFSCEKGEVHALIGENGAGKSTLVKILCGVVKSNTGNILLKGKECSIDTPMEAEKHGIVAVFQELSVLPELSVAENVYLGHEPRNRFNRIDRKKMNLMTQDLLHGLALDIDPQSMVGDLPLATQQLVEIAKALSKDPELIIFDEATSALGRNEVEHLFHLIHKLVKEENKAVIFISHRMNELNEIADRATIYRDARYITSFKWGTVKNEQIVNWIAGRDLNETFPERSVCSTTEKILQVENFNFGKTFRNISVDLARGEILGIAGLAGHGQSEFLKALYGAFPVESGTISVKNQNVKIKTPSQALKNGIAMVPEDRKTNGLLLSRSIKENLVLTVLEKITFGRFLGFISQKKESSRIHETIEALQIKASNIGLEVESLSGGNQQKVVIGKTILTEAEILILADPTRGIDIGTKFEIYQLIKKLSEQGKSIIIYSTELMELVGLCNRVCVFKQGEIVAVLEGDEISENNIVSFALGIENGRDEADAE